MLNKMKDLILIRKNQADADEKQELMKMKVEENKGKMMQCKNNRRKTNIGKKEDHMRLKHHMQN